jgi:hypothetical protein
MNPASNSLCISSPMTLRFSSSKRRKRCFTGLEPAQISKVCSVTSLGMTGISEGLHAKMSMFARRKSTITVSYLGSRVALMLNAFSLWVGGVEGHELDIFCGLEAAGVALGVEDLVGQTVKVCRQGHRL